MGRRGKMRVIGIDPGLRNLGWGVIEAEGTRLRHIANGTIHPPGWSRCMTGSAR